MSELWRDRYEPLEVVGRGGQGSVVRALDHLHRRHVALKLRPRGEPDEQEALLAEARVLLGLQPHPLVALARDDFFLDDRYVLVMDWIPGTSLAQRLAQREGAGLPLDDVLGWLTDVAQALDHLHGHRPPVIHGDVKPANVVLTEEGTAVLVDFGIARRQSLGGEGSRAGSGSFTAPELARGAETTPAADVFSLAATAFTLLVGEPPGPGVMPDWSLIAGERAGEVETALRQGLAIDPSRRPASAGQFVAALRGRVTPPHNLPVALTSFVGRKDDLTSVAARLSTSRLLTLIGTGGLGKTRLAVEVGYDVLSEFPDGVFLVDLAPLADPSLVAQQILTALGLAERSAEEGEPAGHGDGTRRRPMATLTAHLVTRTLLLVLDNCEHLVDACASAADALLRACPKLRILATSRAPLRVPGETTWRIGPLPTTDAVRLFVERASAAVPDFRLNEANAFAIAAVCTQVDGIPLAVELAAARTNVLSVEQIASRLADRFRLLSGGSRTLPERHQSLRAALDWTHDALSPAEQVLFRRLSVFSGSFGLEAAEAVCSSAPVAEEEVLDLLAGLVDKSLVISEGAETGRYRLLETLRQYGGQKADEAGDAGATRARHLEWALRLADTARPHFGGNRGAETLAALEADHDNLRAALVTASSPEAAGAALIRLVAALGPFWRTGGYLEEGRRWAEVALSRPDEGHDRARVSVLQEAAAIAFRQGDFDVSRNWYEESMARAEALADERSVVDARHGLARVIARQGDLSSARVLHEENLAARRRLGDRPGVAESLMALARVGGRQGEPGGDLLAESVAILRTLEEPSTLASALTMWGQSRQGSDPDATRSAYREALDIRKRLGDRLGEADTLAALANLEQVYANFPEAHALFERVLAIRREMGNRADLAQALFQMGQMVQYRGDYDEARPYFEEAISVARKIGDVHGEANALEGLALLSMFQSDFAAAKPLVERALALVRQQGDRTCEQQMLMTLGDACWGEGDFRGATALYRESVALAGASGRRIRVVYLLERLGSGGSLGDFRRAARLLGAAQAMRNSLNLPRPTYSVSEWDRDVGVARRGLGEEAFLSAWNEGAAMPLDELVQYAAEEPQSL